MGAKSLGPSIWAVSDGRAGNVAQVRAVMQALSEPERWMKIAHIDGEGHRAEPITLTARPPWLWLPSDKWPAPKAALPSDQKAILTSPWPTVWIAAGRRAAAYTRAVREWSGGETLTVQILNPRIDPSNFDIMATPAHDEISGNNVVSTIGSPSFFTPEAIEHAEQAFADLADQRGKSCIVVLGGDSKTHTFTKSAVTRLAGQLGELAKEGWRIRITTSRRTPAHALATFRTLADEINAEIWAGDADGPNPYLAWLLYSDAAIVTEDSANMLSDAAWHGLPVHIARLEGRAAKFDKFHESLIEHGCARWFSGTLETWKYPPLREASRLADVIAAKLIERHPA